MVLALWERSVVPTVDVDQIRGEGALDRRLPFSYLDNIYFGRPYVFLKRDALLESSVLRLSEPAGVVGGDKEFMPAIPQGGHYSCRRTSDLRCWPEIQ